jgi:hypothetical protein
MNARAISLSRQIPSTLTFFVVAVLHGCRCSQPRALRTPNSNAWRRLRLKPGCCDRDLEFFEIRRSPRMTLIAVA